MYPARNIISEITEKDLADPKVRCEGTHIRYCHPVRTAALSYQAAVVLTDRWGRRAVAESLVTGAELWSYPCAATPPLVVCPVRQYRSLQEGPSSERHSIELHCDAGGDFVVVELGRRRAVWLDPVTGAVVRSFAPHGKIVLIMPVPTGRLAGWYVFVTKGRRGRHFVYGMTPHGAYWSLALPGEVEVSLTCDGEYVVLQCGGALPPRPLLHYQLDCATSAFALETGKPVDHVISLVADDHYLHTTGARRQLLRPHQRGLAGRPNHFYSRVTTRQQLGSGNRCYQIADGADDRTMTEVRYIWPRPQHSAWSCDGWQHCVQFDCRSRHLQTLWYAGRREIAQLELACVRECRAALERAHAAASDSARCGLMVAIEALYIVYEHSYFKFRKL